MIKVKVINPTLDRNEPTFRLMMYCKNLLREYGIDITDSDDFDYMFIGMNDFINKKIVRFEHHGFPLDLAALNAEKVLNCFTDNKKKLNFLNEIYEKQDVWANGSDINNINSNLIKIAKNHGLNDVTISKCLNDEILRMKF